MNIEKLPSWAILRSRYAFRDVESDTAIEQTARLYQAIQDIIDSCNEFSVELQKEVDTFTENQTKDYEENKKELTKIIHEFIHSIDTKVDTAVNYMRTNLNESIASIVQEMKESGELSEEIVNSFNNLDTRVQTIENTEYSLVHDPVTENLTLLKTTNGGGE